MKLNSPARSSRGQSSGRQSLLRGAYFTSCWAGQGACSGIFSRRSSLGVHAGRYTAGDAPPVVTRGKIFNGRNAQADARWLSCGMYVRKGKPPSHKPEISAGPSTIFHAAEAGKVDPRTTTAIGEHQPAPWISRSNDRPAAPISARVAQLYAYYGSCWFDSSRGHLL